MSTNPIEPKPEAAAAQPFAALPAGLSAWIGALQLTVIFAATGFIGKVSLQQFLGIDLGNWTATDLCLFAGHWAFDTLAAALNEVFTHPFRFDLPLCLYVAPLVLAYVLPEISRWKRRATQINLALMTVALLFVLARYEVPTLDMKGWLIVPVSDQLKPSNGGLLNDRRSDLQATLVVSRMENVHGLGNAKDSGGLICPAQNPAESQVLARHLKSAMPAEAALEKLKRIYAFTVLIWMVGWFGVFFHSPIDGPGVQNEIFRGLRLFLCLLVLPTVGCLTPYMYAKLIYSTEFSLVTVVSNSDDKATGKAAPNGDEAEPVKKKFLVMDETDKDISLLMVIPGDTPYVEIRGRDGIKKINRYGTEDVINNIILGQCNSNP